MKPADTQDMGKPRALKIPRDHRGKQIPSAKQHGAHQRAAVPLHTRKKSVGQSVSPQGECTKKAQGKRNRFLRHVKIAHQPRAGKYAVRQGEIPFVISPFRGVGKRGFKANGVACPHLSLNARRVQDAMHPFTVQAFCKYVKIGALIGSADFTYRPLDRHAQISKSLALYGVPKEKKSPERADRDGQNAEAEKNTPPCATEQDDCRKSKKYKKSHDRQNQMEDRAEQGTDCQRQRKEKAENR